MNRKFTTHISKAPPAIPSFKAASAPDIILTGETSTWTRQRASLSRTADLSLSSKYSRDIMILKKYYYFHQCKNPGIFDGDLSVSASLTASLSVLMPSCKQ